MVADGERTITYNADNLPVQINHGISVNFTYDGNGSRVGKGNKVFIDDLYECSGSSCAKYIFAGSEQIAMKQASGEVYYYHPDHLGGTSLMTYDGNVVEDLFYKPFGETVEQLAGGVNPTHQFTGQEFDGETGLYFYNARYYNPTIGRFVSADSIVPDSSDSQSFNRYSYVRNNPVNFVDPSGHADEFVDNLMATGNYSFMPDGYEFFSSVETDYGDLNLGYGGFGGGSFGDTFLDNNYSYPFISSEPNSMNVFSEIGEDGHGVNIGSSSFSPIDCHYGARAPLQYGRPEPFATFGASASFLFTTHSLDAMDFDPMNRTIGYSRTWTSQKFPGASLDVTFGQKGKLEIGVGGRHFGTGVELDENGERIGWSIHLGRSWTFLKESLLYVSVNPNYKDK